MPAIVTEEEIRLDGRQVKEVYGETAARAVFNRLNGSTFVVHEDGRFQRINSTGELSGILEFPVKPQETAG
jgi:hypothetical protein